MKPKTTLQKEIIRLSATLPELTNAQRTYAFRHCFKHYGKRNAKGIITCTECGHAWKSGHSLADTICGCICPNCGTALEIVDTRKRVFTDNEYFSIITTCKGYQVIRFFFTKSRQKVGQKAEYSICEVVQRWITPDGKSETVARLRGMSPLYYDLWINDSPMEIRKNNGHRVYDIDPICTYPRLRVIPEIKRNGFNGKFHGILPYDFFTTILSDNKAETLLKAEQYPMLRYYARHRFNLSKYWQSVKICIRNGYTIPDGSMWRDMTDLLHHFGKDLGSPKYVCPADLKAEHDRLVRKREQQRERERTEEERQKALEYEKNYLKAKGMFFGMMFTDNLILVKVIESVEEMIAEGRAMHHCVGQYHKRENSLILSATIDGERIETVEVDLQTLRVVQSRGVCNSNTEYHDRIIKLVEDNAEQIRQRMNAA